jgi:dihydroflavonol-4-reductase
MKILLIGATGQIGYALAQALVEAGHQLTVLVRNDRLPFPASVQVVTAPSFDEATFARLLPADLSSNNPPFDCAIYGIGLPEQFAFDTGIFERVNLHLFQTFTRVMARSALRRLLYISTYEVFQARQMLIRETHPLADISTLSPYFRAMTQAYVHATEFATQTGTRLTTIHPAAVYGGLNTAEGFTNVIENLLNWRVWNLPTVLPGRFPLVHAQSLAQATISALDHDGAFLVSDGMSSLKEMARALRLQTRSYVPPQVPAALAYGATALVEALGRALRFRPMLCKAQLDFITAGFEPVPDRATQTLAWQPLPLAAGLQRYLQERVRWLGVGKV